MGMEVFGVGVPEMVIIAVIALIFLGPERLPEVARTVGGWVRQVRDLTSEATGVWQETLGVGETIRDSMRLDGNPTHVPPAASPTSMPITFTPPAAGLANPAFTPPPLDYPAPFVEPPVPVIRTSEVLDYPAPASD